jgi:formylglycine-generating enzyme required for sulfatase activity
MQAYEEPVEGGALTIRMLPIPAGRFLMGSPPEESDRKEDEGPQHEVELAAFWMSEVEIPWEVYHEFMQREDRRRDVRDRGVKAAPSDPRDAWADAVSRPTPPYVPMDFEMGVEGYPAICMTQLAAKQFTKWLSMKSGRFYRLPSEAEWEYACRAGTTSAYSFGEDVEALDEYAWYFDNSDGQYQKVGKKKPNPWGLRDMHGNVAEWVLDAHDAGYYATFEGRLARSPVNWPTELYPRIVRGGSWDDDPDRLRSAARRESKASWKIQDPQLPKSIWYHTDAPWVGFRVVRPFSAAGAGPGSQERERSWEPDLDELRDILERQRRGGR